MKPLDAARNPLDKPTVIVAGIGAFAAGALLFNTLPLVLGVTADAMALSSQQIGWLGTAYLLAFIVISPPAVFLMQRINWRRINVISSISVSLFLIVAAKVEVYTTLIVVFFLIGLGKSMLFAQGNRVLGATSDPDRLVGIGYFISLVIPAGLLFLYSNLVIPQWGHAGVYVITALVIILLATASPWLPSDGGASKPDGHQARGNLTADIVFGLLSLTFFFVGAAALWTFIERIGVSKGIEQSTVGTILSIGLIVTAFASLLPMITEGKISRSNMLFLMFILASIAMYSFSLPYAMPHYFIAVMLYVFAWGAAIVYITAVIATADDAGHFLVLISGAAGLGAGIGPALAGYLIHENDYGNVFIMSASAIFLSVMLARLSEGLHARRSRIR